MNSQNTPQSIFTRPPYTRLRPFVKAILWLLCLCAVTAQAKELGVDATTASTLNCSLGCTTVANAKSVTFVLAAATTCTIAGIAFDSSVDSSIRFAAPAGDVITGISVLVSAGQVKIIRTQ